VRRPERAAHGAGEPGGYHRAGLQEQPLGLKCTGGQYGGCPSSGPAVHTGGDEVYADLLAIQRPYSILSSGGIRFRRSESGQGHGPTGRLGCQDTGRETTRSAQRLRRSLLTDERGRRRS
jgi:hypothetical protein